MRSLGILKNYKRNIASRSTRLKVRIKIENIQPKKRGESFNAKDTQVLHKYHIEASTHTWNSLVFLGQLSELHFQGTAQTLQHPRHSQAPVARGKRQLNIRYGLRFTPDKRMPGCHGPFLAAGSLYGFLQKSTRESGRSC